MKRVTLKGLNRYAEDHNKQNRDDNWTWEDVLYYWAECGNNMSEYMNAMSKKETLIVMDWAAHYCFADDVFLSQQRIYKELYDAAKDSLMNRL